LDKIWPAAAEETVRVAALQALRAVVIDAVVVELASQLLPATALNHLWVQAVRVPGEEILDY
jgi:hypothetical protein